MNSPNPLRGTSLVILLLAGALSAQTDRSRLLARGLAPAMTPLALGPTTLSLQDPTADEGEATWTSSIAVGIALTAGNTKRRNANAGADIERRLDEHRTSGKFAWDYAEEKEDTDTDYRVDQRHVQGSLKHDYFFAEKEFVFVGTGAENDYDKNISLRYTATMGLGLQLIEEEELSFAVEVGAGQTGTQSSVSGVADTDNLVVQISTDLTWRASEKIKLSNTVVAFPSLEDGNDVFGSSDTKLEFPVTDGGALRTQIQWIVDYDNTPNLGSTGVPNDRVDHRLFLNLVWSF